MEFKIVGNHIELAEPPTRPKKLTATRFGAVLGMNQWKTPFQMWCEITRLYEEPFEDTVYTIAGKTIEPKVIDYLKRVYRLPLKTPTDVYGKDYFKKTRGDFFKEYEVFGGMWDVVGDDFVVEIKTTKRAEDWLDDVPIYYKLQAGLYAWLTDVDTFYLTCSFLDDNDYVKPEAFDPSAKNTIIREFSLSEDLPNFEDDYIQPALDWWNEYVKTGVSPDFDEKLDAEYLKAIRTNVIEGDASVASLVDSIETKQAELDRVTEQVKAIEKELKKQKETLKNYLQKQFKESDKKVELIGDNYVFTVNKKTSEGVDKEALKADGLLKKYTTLSTSYALTVAKKKEGK